MKMDNFDDIIVERKEEQHVAIIRLNRPKALNALRNELCGELCAALVAIDKDTAMHCAVLIGTGDKAFAAGADIKQMKEKDFAAVTQSDLLSTWTTIQSFRKPLIAAVNGYALGGGCELAMMCDIIIASDKAKFGQPEIALGTIPGMGGTQRLTRAVGKSKAMEWILTGRQWTAKEALDAGLISSIVPIEQLEDEATKLAAEIAKFSKPTVAAAKECVNRAFESSLQEGLLFERRLFHSSFATEDRMEGMTAFVEKRQPKWSHR